MSILNKDFIKEFISNNYVEEVQSDGTIACTQERVPYRWTHGATEYHMGDGLLIYSVIQLMRYKTCVCLGSGGGFIMNASPLRPSFQNNFLCPVLRYERR